MDPRWYQSASVAACWDSICREAGNPCIVLPTGAGKSLVIAMLARDVVAWGGRCLVLAHRKELLEQNAEKIASCLPGLDVGVYSAGLGRKEYSQSIVVAGVQSCFRKGAAYNIGHRDVVIVDEAHLIPLRGEGMYRQLLEHLLAINPSLRIVGLTATPYRLDHGLVCGPESLLNSVCFEVPLTRLIDEGFLCPLTSKQTSHTIETEGVKTSGGEFVQGQLDQSAAKEDVVRAATLELLSWTHDRRSVLLFACGRKHAAMLAQCITEQVPADQVAYVDGETASGERADTLSRFKAGSIRYLVNIDVLTTGFDAPNVDCVALFRPTLSPGLLYQMVGRGFRLHHAKENCLVLDFAGNIRRHGPIDQLKAPERKAAGSGAPGEAPTKACPQCKELVILQARECPACGYQYPEPEARHEAQASELPVLSTQIAQPIVEWVEVVREPVYMVYKNEHKPHRTLRAIYKLKGAQAVSEYVCLDHPVGSFGRRKAEAWWAKRSKVACPTSCWEAYHMLKKAPGILAAPLRMQLKWIPGRKWPDILDVELSEPSEELSQAAIDEAREIAEIQQNLFTNLKVTCDD